jgi:hypothetical protein
MAFSLNAINAMLYDKLNFNFIRDTAPVASIASVPSLGSQYQREVAFAHSPG